MTQRQSQDQKKDFFPPAISIRLNFSFSLFFKFFLSFFFFKGNVPHRVTQPSKILSLVSLLFEHLHKWSKAEDNYEATMKTFQGSCKRAPELQQRQLAQLKPQTVITNPYPVNCSLAGRQESCLNVLSLPGKCKQSHWTLLLQVK